MNSTLGVLLGFLGRNQWNIRLYPGTNESTPPRGGKEQLGPIYMEFLATVEECINANETCRFNCIDEFYGTKGSDFAWNEWELLSRENAVSADETQAIEEFWEDHLPVVVAVQPTYSFLSLRLSNGAICFGREPLFEEITVVAPHFEGFVSNLLDGLLPDEIQHLFEGV